jgi:acyl-CoA reductase-like NAD-dependent aldehyde dehydrogenase
MFTSGAKSASQHVADNKAMQLNPAMAVEEARKVQPGWAALNVRGRIQILRRFRHALAEAANDLAACVPLELPGGLHRTIADTMVAEVLPLAEACRFLEREAESVLAARKLSTASRPFWLRGVETEVHREPLGVVLIIGPANYPLFLPGAQVLQALAAGNAVLWKPAPGGSSVAKALQLLLIEAGIDPSLLQILDEKPESAVEAIRAGVAKIVLTGSESTGRAVLHEAAEMLTPAIVELSGCDAVFILEGADLERAVVAITFALRLNGSATCMAPRRLFVTAAVADKFVPALTAALKALGPVSAPESSSTFLQELMFEAENEGAKFILNGFDGAARIDGGGTLLYPTLVAGANPHMRITQADIFVPVLSVIKVECEKAALAAYAQCPYSLTASIFGAEGAARKMAQQISAGSVLVNDIIVSTADPRAPFGGRKRSGYGVTRGREGLLDMTAPKTIQVQRTANLRAYAELTPDHASFFAGYLRMVHGHRSQRWQALKEFLRAIVKVR